MVDLILDGKKPIDVAVIGGGPAGLAAATALKHRGVSRVVVLDREPEAGGIPRHCGHIGFGMRELKRILPGPKYAKNLVHAARTAGVEIHTSTTVVEARPSGVLLITTNKGKEEISARRIIYATGVRETPRSARLIPGSRPQGVMNTGALQSMIYLKGQKPFERPVIVGTELVSFSAIMTCRHAKIRPVAMLEESSRVTARWPSSLYPRLMGIPLHLGARVVAIEGINQVSAVVIEDANGARRTIDCDGVILTGRFTPEASLALCGHLTVDDATGGPVVDQYGRCSDPVYFAAGNLLRPVETAGWSWQEGKLIGNVVADDLDGRLPASEKEMPVSLTDPIKFVIPQRISLPLSTSGMQNFQLRFTRQVEGTLVVRQGADIIWSKQISALPERRILIPIKTLLRKNAGDLLEITFRQTGE